MPYHVEIEPSDLGHSPFTAPRIGKRMVRPRVFDHQLPTVRGLGDQRTDVDLKPLQHLLAGQGQLLDPVIEGHVLGESEESRQAPVGVSVNAGDVRPANVQGNVVRLVMGQGGQNPVSANHRFFRDALLRPPWPHLWGPRLSVRGWPFGGARLDAWHPRRSYTPRP